MGYHDSPLSQTLLFMYWSTKAMSLNSGKHIIITDPSERYKTSPVICFWMSSRVISANWQNLSFELPNSRHAKFVNYYSQSNFLQHFLSADFSFNSLSLVLTVIPVWFVSQDERSPIICHPFSNTSQITAYNVRI